jgi:hypothetical protein
MAHALVSEPAGVSRPRFVKPRTRAGPERAWRTIATVCVGVACVSLALLVSDVAHALRFGAVLTTWLALSASLLVLTARCASDRRISLRTDVMLAVAAVASAVSALCA